MHQRFGYGAVDPHHRSVLNLLLARGTDQRPIDRLPALRADRTDRLVKHRLLRRPAQRQPGKGDKRRRILQMKRQLLVTQLAILLQHRAAHHGFRRQAIAARRPNLAATQIIHHQGEQFAVLIEPLRHRSQFSTDLVFGKIFKYSSLDDALQTQRRARVEVAEVRNTPMLLPETAQFDSQKTPLPQAISKSYRLWTGTS